MSLVLRPLTAEDETAFLRARSALARFGTYYQQAMPWLEYLAILDAAARGEGLPDNQVPNSLLVGAVGDGFVGSLALRHHIDHPILSTLGGHIGYSVLKAHRRRGYGTEMLRQALPIAKNLGLDRVLITCDATNVASRRIIETNGGVYESSVTEGVAVAKLRYWVEL